MSKSPALRTLHSHIDPVPFFLGVFPLAHFRPRNVKHCCVIIFPLFIPLETLVGLEVDMIAAPNYGIYQFYQCLKIKNASLRY